MSFQVKQGNLKGVYQIRGEKFEDHRGSLNRVYDEKEWSRLGLNTHWVQEYLSVTRQAGTIRGIHVSLPPHQEGKMIQALSGIVYWVCVDLRRGSESFGKWEATTLSSAQPLVLYVEEGFAHGCLSLTDNCSLLIHSDTFFSSEHGTGICWNDEELKIDWPLEGKDLILSDRDKNYGTFADFKRAHRVH